MQTNTRSRQLLIFKLSSTSIFLCLKCMQYALGFHTSVVASNKKVCSCRSCKRALLNTQNKTETERRPVNNKSKSFAGVQCVEKIFSGAYLQCSYWLGLIELFSCELKPESTICNSNCDSSSSASRLHVSFSTDSAFAKVRGPSW